MRVFSLIRGASVLVFLSAVALYLLSGECRCIVPCGKSQGGVGGLFGRGSAETVPDVEPADELTKVRLGVQRLVCGPKLGAMSTGADVPKGGGGAAVLLAEAKRVALGAHTRLQRVAEPLKAYLVASAEMDAKELVGRSKIKLADTKACVEGKATALVAAAKAVDKATVEKWATEAHASAKDLATRAQVHASSVSVESAKAAAQAKGAELRAAVLAAGSADMLDTLILIAATSLAIALFLSVLGHLSKGMCCKDEAEESKVDASAAAAKAETEAAVKRAAATAEAEKKAENAPADIKNTAEEAGGTPQSATPKFKLHAHRHATPPPSPARFAKKKISGLFKGKSVGKEHGGYLVKSTAGKFGTAGELGTLSVTLLDFCLEDSCREDFGLQTGIIKVVADWGEMAHDNLRTNEIKGLNLGKVALNEKFDFAVPKSVDIKGSELTLYFGRLGTSGKYVANVSMYTQDLISNKAKLGKFKLALFPMKSSAWASMKGSPGHVSVSLEYKETN